MTGIIRRTLLGAGVLAVAGAAVYVWRGRGAVPAHADIAYGTDPRQRLDIHLPEGEGPFPVVVDIHGGAFRVGDKAGMPATQAVLDAGIAIVRINYRYSSTAVWPAQGDDCLSAVVFLQREGRNYGIDPSRLALWGQSAGAFLAVSTALTLVEAGLPPRGVVSFYGPMDFSTMDADMATLGRVPAMGATDPADSAESQLLGYAVGEKREAARAAGPIGRLERLSEPLPPIFIRHGDADPLIADLQASRLRNAWAAADPAAEVDFALVPGAGHGGGGFDTEVVIGPMVAFLVKALA